MVNWSRALLAPATVAALIGLAGCGSGSAPATPASAAAQPNGGGMAGMEGMEGMDHGGGGHSVSNGEIELWAVQSGPLGVVVTDGTGQLVYRSDSDTAAPSVSNCTGDCTATWQPVVADLDKPPILLGVDESAVSVVSRPDGVEQLTIAGWPIYRHIGEHGGLEGTQANGTDGVWFAIRPDGNKAA
jgi:predicted lipoprotein with Yx(FWY)xxD motif